MLEYPVTQNSTFFLNYNHDNKGAKLRLAFLWSCFCDEYLIISSIIWVSFMFWYLIHSKLVLNKIKKVFAVSVSVIIII